MSINKQQTSISFRGGGQVGSMQSSFPFSTLFVNAEKLTLYFNLNSYVFSPQQIVSFTKKRNSVKIIHTVKDYPSEIYFISSTSSSNTIKRIKQIGFVPCGNIDKTVIKRDSPFRNSFIKIFYLLCVIFAILYSINLFRQSFDASNECLGIQLCIIFLIPLLLMSIITYYLHYLQNLIIKPGRYFGEVKHTFTMFIEMISFCLAVFSTCLFGQEPMTSIGGGLIFIVGFILIFTMPIIRANYLSKKQL
ncbi:MAG: hypothetical protein AAGA80_08570 [Cyanobacteria bacterium P01_F01_bin.143]